METLRRQIGIDNLRSHICGIVPFCEYNGGNDIVYVDAGVYNGNFKQYVCDLAFIDASGVTVDGVAAVNETEYSRMVYLDTLRKYYFIEKLIKEGTLIEKRVDNYLSVSGDVCDYSFEFSGSPYIWEKCDDEVWKYDVAPVPQEAFNVDLDTGKYYFNEDYSEFSSLVETSKKLLLITDYDKYKQYEDEWEKWWSDGFAHAGGQGSWETTYLDENYVMPTYFKFCQDFEKYFIGMVYVPEVFNDEPISGGKVPEVVFYLNFMDYLNWFKDNEFKLSNDKSLKDEWDRRGGDNFYAFLQTISPIWIKKYEPTLEEGDCETYFTFVAPYMNMLLFFQGNVKEERMYSPYEYDLVETEYGLVKSGATKSYIVPSEGIGSALTPHFVEFLKWEEVAYGDNTILSGTDIYEYFYSLDVDERKEEEQEDGTVILKMLDGDTWLTLGSVLDYEAFSEYGVTLKTYKETEVTDNDTVIHYFLAKDDECGKMETRLPSLYSDDTIYLADDIFGVFEKFKDGNGRETAQLFECTYHTGTSITPKTIVHFSGYSYDYRIIDHYDEQGNYIKEYVPHKVINRDVEYAEIAEEAPKVTEDCYQVVGVKIIGGGNTEILTSDSAETAYNAYGMKDTEYWYWSAVTTNIYEWWECKKVSFDANMVCADGEDVPAGTDTNKYRSVTLLSNLVNFVNDNHDGNTYYFMAVFDNGVVSKENGFKWTAGETEITRADFAGGDMVKTMKLPFESGTPRNLISFGEGDEAVVAYDEVTDMTYNEDTMNLEISYVLGATSGTTDSAETESLLETTGVHCFEVIPYNIVKENLPVDGIHMAEVYYEKLDYASQEETVENKEYGLERKAQLALITGMEVATQWTEDGAITTPLITRDGVSELLDDIRYEIDAIYDRGNAAAWEKHFKLAECNTLEDLKKYSNNIFNL